MSMTTIAPAEDVYVEPWERWQLAYAASSRRTTRHAAIAFAGIFVVLAVLIGMQF